jgi:diguanylate cyclase (GGDEF)-like protein
MKTPQSSRKRILQLSAPLDNFYSVEFWRGASDEALRLGYDFISLCGGIQVSWLGGIEAECPSNEARSTLMYQLFSHELYDGVIIWGAQLKHDADDRAIQALIDYFSPLPVVSVGWNGQGITGLSVDNYLGMKDLLNHLIVVHGHKKIACLKTDTPFENIETIERFKGITDALEEAGLSMDPVLLVDGKAIECIRAKLDDRFIAYSWAVLGIQELLDNRKLIPGKDFTALVARDDPAALGAIEELGRRGYRVPEDVAVIGFDNVIQGRCAIPPLSTVSQSFREQGAGAVRRLDGILNKTVKPGNAVLHTTRVIIRESCGCANRFAKSILGTSCDFGPSAISGELRQAGMEQLLALVSSGRRANDLLHTVNATTQLFRAAGEDPLELVPLVEEMSQNGLIDQNTRTAANVVAGDLAQRLQLMDRMNVEQRRETLDTIDRNIFASYDMQVILPSIEAELPALGARACALVVYVDPAHPDEMGRVLMSVQGNDRFYGLDDQDEPFPVKDLLPARFWPDSKQPRSWYIQGLHFGTRRIGYLVLEDQGSEGRSFTSLAQRLSGAIEGAFLVQDLNKKQQELEKAYSEIVSLSNHDPLTNLSNRRDFERELIAEHRRMVRLGQALSKSYTLLFIDLDNFKYYNDNFGHDVGDAALIAFARLAQSCIRETDIIARYGGDEFVCLLPETPLEGAVIVAERVLQHIIATEHLKLEIQQIAGRELLIPPQYLLNCSIGISTHVHGKPYEDVVKLADAGLYKAKNAGKGCWAVAEVIPGKP